MSDGGLVEVPNPSALFLGGHQGAAERSTKTVKQPMRRRSAARRCSPASRARGRCWSRSRRWSRPPCSARRAARWSAGTATRLAMIIAVLDARCGLSVGANDIYLNVAGGLRIAEPAADLAVAAALVSALERNPGAGRHRRLWRDRAVRRGPPGRPQRSAAQGSGEARLCRSLDAAIAAAAVDAREAGAGPAMVGIGHLSELVARLSPKRAPRAPRADRSRIVNLARSGGSRRDRVVGDFAFARGFVREALSIAAWVGAALITLYGFDSVYGFTPGL